MVSTVSREVRSLIDSLPATLDPFETDPNVLRDSARRTQVKQALSGTEEALGQAAASELLGLGSLDALLADPGVQRISADRQGIRIDRGTGFEASDATFSSPRMFDTIARRLLRGAGFEGNTGTFAAHGFNATVAAPPAASSALITLVRPLDRASVVARGLMTAEQADELIAAPRAGRDVLIVGARRNVDVILGMFDGIGIDIDVGHGSVSSAGLRKDILVSQAQAFSNSVVVSGAAPRELADLGAASVVGVSAHNLETLRASLAASGISDAGLDKLFAVVVVVDRDGKVSEITTGSALQS